MRKGLKLAVVVGGLSALVWGMRKRVRLAIGRGDETDPDYHIIDPVPDSPVDEDPADTEPEGDTQSSTDDDPQPPAGASNGVS